MPDFRRSAILAVTIAAALGYVVSSYAHDLHGLVAERNAMDPQLRAKFDDVNELRRILAARAAAAPQDGQLEAVVQTALKWPGNKASVCFFDGRREARDHVAETAQKWSNSNAMRLDFGPEGNRRTCDSAVASDIRVSFRGSGYWSYVGIQAKHINSRKQTLNLQGLDKSSFDSEDDGVILHEFGHAIGFEHEHQSPVGGCDEEFNWDYLYTSMGWSPEEVDRNMKRLNVSSNMSGLLTTEFDRKSIMLYSLSPDAFKNAATAKCFISKPNNDISKIDQTAVQTVYPALPVQGPAAAPALSAAKSMTPDATTLAQSMKRLKDFSEGK